MTKPVPFKFKVVKEVVLPVRQLAIDAPAYLQFTAPMKIVDSVDESTGETKDLPIMNCIDLETQQSCQVVVPSVLFGILTDTYPVESNEVETTDEAGNTVKRKIPVDGAVPAYVGKNFEIIKGRKPSGKRYHTFQVKEIEVE